MTHPAPLYPPALKKGDSIGVIAPSSAWDVEKLEPAITILKTQGFNVVLHPQTDLKHNQFAGTSEDKLSAIHDFFQNPEIKAIFCTCGGNGVIHYLDQIDYNLIQQNPKIFIGFSDVTLLLNAIFARTGLVTFHGPTMTRLDKLNPKWLQNMIDVLTGQSNTCEINTAGHNLEGRIIGGNLSVAQALIGTPYAPPLKNGILLLEDTNDHLSRYDRMIAHMKLAGWFDDLSGVILGEFLNSRDNPERPFGLTIEEIVKTHAPDIPIITNAPFGHGDRLCTLPIGAEAVLKNNKLSFKSLT